jgi:serine protease Do
LYNTWSEPGLFFAASSSLTSQYDEGSLLDLQKEEYSKECTYEGRSDYADQAYTGFYDLYTDCGGVGTSMISLAAGPQGREFLILVEVQVITEADLDALDRILASFEVVGTLPVP